MTSYSGFYETARFRHDGTVTGTVFATGQDKRMKVTAP
jgi:hypothetical protein